MPRMCLGFSQWRNQLTILWKLRQPVYFLPKLVVFMIYCCYNQTPNLLCYIKYMYIFYSYIRIPARAHWEKLVSAWRSINLNGAIGLEHLFASVLTGVTVKSKWVVCLELSWVCWLEASIFLYMCLSMGFMGLFQH